ncbi:MAG: alpha/beta fold hydrolase, partial [Pseudomonadota bacterium]
LDLREENSFIRWMTDQGHTVFLVSWVNPDPSLAELTFRDYAKEGVFAALDAIEEATGEREVNAIGYCIGGTLLSCSLAHMAETGDERIKSATYFAAQTDFSEAGDLLVFIDEKQLQNLEKQMEVSGGVLEGTSMAAAFNMLRANDLIWSFVINNYLMGKDPKRFDLLYWNSDATRMPKRLQIDYLREFYMYNKLSRGEFALFDKTLSVKNVKIPVYMQASETDHIAPCVSVFKGAKLFGGPVRFMVAGSGHIAGVINHPDAKKYQHWTNDKIADDKPGSLPGALNDWWENAEEHPGSWWGDWMKWLSPQSGPKVAARIPGEGALKPIEDAPGSYVKVKSLGD